MPALGGLATPRSSGQIFYDAFNATGSVPKNWTQILGALGDIKETHVVKSPVFS
jgi:hypothetical protein